MSCLSSNTWAVSPTPNRWRSLSPSTKRDTPYKCVNQQQVKRDNDKDDDYWIGEFEKYIKCLGSVGYCVCANKSSHGRRQKNVIVWENLSRTTSHNYEGVLLRFATIFL